MIDQLDKVLRRVLGDSGAQAAVIIARRPDSDEAVVLTSCPTGVVPAGTGWPGAEAAAGAGIERDPARLAALIPAPVRIALPVAPLAAAAFRLTGDPDLSLVMTWSVDPAGNQPADRARHLIEGEVSYLASVIEESRFHHGESARLLTVMNTLDEGVVSVEPHLGQANINAAAAKLLGLPPGQIPAADFATAVRRLCESALNHAEVAAAGCGLHDHGDAEVEYTWRFAGRPSHLRVRSTAVHRGAFSGRVWTFTDESALSRALETSERDRELLRANTDAMLDPQAVVEVVRDAGGVVVDLRYLDVNEATCTYLGMRRAELIGSLVASTLPNLDGSGLLAHFANCALAGTPVVLDDFPYFNEILGLAAHYDVRAAQVRPGVISLTWRDVTDRFQARERIAQSERLFRLIAENSGDVVTRIRDGRFLWVSPSIEQALAAPPQHWVGKPVAVMIPAGGEDAHRERLRRLAIGETVFTRVRLVGADGVEHWFHLHAKPFYTGGGELDGATASLRPIDEEVAAEQAAAESQRRQAAADTRYRALIDGSAVAMNVCDARGRFQILNPAMCELFGYDEATLLTKTWEELTAPEFLEIDLRKMREVLDGKIDAYRLTKEHIHADGHPIWGHLSVSCVRDAAGDVENFIAQIIDVTAEVTAAREAERFRALEEEANARYRRLMDSSPVPMNVCDPDGRFQIVNHAMCEFFGFGEQQLKSKTWQELTAPAFLGSDVAAMTDMIAGRTDSHRATKQYIHADGHPIWGDLSVSCVRDATGAVENFVAQIIDVTAEVSAELRAAEARRRQAEADARYRRLMDSSAVGMTLITPDGRFDVVNQALCDFFGYDAATLCAKTWQEVTAADYLDADLDRVEDVLAGRIDSYRMTKQYVHADGHLIWGDLSVSCLRDDDGHVERFISQITDITAEVEARQRVAQRDQQNRVLTRRLQAQGDRLKAELDSAAQYVRSILPDDLSGRVQVSSRYLPSRELGGDCFDYAWIDDDHLMIYLVDVSGHGIAPALMSISVYNMLRTGSVEAATQRSPAAALDELNRRFPMDRQDDHYFTIWYGVYEASTRTLRCASAGHPPALLLSSGSADPLKLGTPAMPIGMFADTVYTAETYPIPPAARVLVCSDGAFELPPSTGTRWGWDEFVDLCAEQARTPGWSVDDLLADLRLRTAAGLFEDDCSLVLLSFD